MKTTCVPNKKHFRPHKGFSLVTVTLIGLIATMWLTASLTALIPAYQLSAQHRYQSSALALAEASADWAVDSLNQGLITGDFSKSIDTGSQVLVPANVLNNPLAAAHVTVKNLTIPSNSYLYSSFLSPLDGRTNPNSLVTTNGWRVVEATAVLGGVTTKNVRTVLRPSYYPLSSTPNPSLNYAVFGTSSLQIANSQTDGFDSSSGQYSFFRNRYRAAENFFAGLGGDVGSFSKVSLGNRVTIGGSVDVTLQPAGSSQKTAFGTGNNSTTVNRYMNLNGIQDGTFADNTASSPTVKGYSNQSQGFSNDLASSRPDSILEHQGAAAPQLPPAPPVPSTFVDGNSNYGAAVNLGDLNIGTSDSTTIINVSASAPQPPYTIVAGQTNNIRPGNYSVDSLNIGSNAQIQVSTNLGGQPFRLFVDGNSGSTSAINITGSNGIRNAGAPANVQIYYNGTKSVNVNNTGGLNAVVYAPNAALNLAPSNTAAFSGSFVGSNVAVNNANIHYDHSLQNGAFMKPLTSSYGVSSSSNAGPNLQQVRYENVTWQQF